MTAYKTLIEECGSMIAAKKWTVAFAESATAGKLAFEFAQSEYSGDILKGSLVCYNACIKEEILGIPESMIEEYTPESAEVTKEMAVRIGRMMKAEVGVAVTGLTTEGGSEEPGKPVGTMFYCILLDGRIIERRKVFTGTPVEIIDLTIEQIAKTIINELKP